MDKEEIKKQILAEMNIDISHAKDRAQKFIDQLDFIPDTFTGNAAFNGFSITLETKDKALFLEIARKAGKKVEKDTDRFSRTGTMNVGGIRSLDIPLPKTCEFEKVEKTYTTYEPIGNCGSWFGKEEGGENEDS